MIAKVLIVGTLIGIILPFIVSWWHGRRWAGPDFVTEEGRLKKERRECALMIVAWFVCSLAAIAGLCEWDRDRFAYIVMIPCYAICEYAAIDGYLRAQKKLKDLKTQPAP